MMTKYILALLLLASAAHAQTEPQCDIVKLPGGDGSFEFSVGASDGITVKICVERTDVAPILEIGCVDVVAGDQTTQIIRGPVPVTIDDDPALYAVAYSALPLKSGVSARCATAPFTRPGAPILFP